MATFWHYIRQTHRLVPPAFHGRVRVSFVLTLLNGLLDIVSLAALVPVLLVFLTPDPIQTNPVVAWLYQAIDPSDPTVFRYTVLSGLVSLFIIKNLASVGVNFFVSKTAFEISTALSKEALKQFFNQPYLKFVQSNSALISRTIKTIPHDFANYLLIPQLQLFTEWVVGLIILAVIAFYHPIICLLLLLATSPLLIAWRWFKQKHLVEIEDDFKTKYPTSLKYLFQGVDAYIDVKLHQKEDFFIEKFIRLKTQMNTHYAYLKTASFIPSKILEVILIISVGVIFIYSSITASEPDLIAVLSIFTAGFYRLYPSITRIINGLTTINAYAYVLDELQPVTQSKSEPSTHAIRFANIIQMQDVSFSYPDKAPLLQHVNLSIRQGECVGIHGVSGSGKTTLIKLLSGLIPTDTGSITVDGIRLASDTTNGWLSQIGYMQQQLIIIDATLEENIAFGQNSPDVKKLNEVIKLANLDDFMATLPQGLSTPLGENGLQISGGQRQRVALARALYRDAELFIFDEISNNLDKANLSQIRTAIEHLIKAGKTILLIDHDPVLLELAETHWEVANGQVRVFEPSFS